MSRALSRGPSEAPVALGARRVGLMADSCPRVTARCLMELGVDGCLSTRDAADGKGAHAPARPNYIARIELGTKRGKRAEVFMRCLVMHVCTPGTAVADTFASFALQTLRGGYCGGEQPVWVRAAVQWWQLALAQSAGVRGHKLRVAEVVGGPRLGRGHQRIGAWPGPPPGSLPGCRARSWCCPEGVGEARQGGGGHPCMGVLTGWLL